MRRVIAIVLLLALLGCAATGQSAEQLVGTWKISQKSSYLRFYADGKAAMWDDSPFTATVWATFTQNTITFHDWDGNLIRRGATLVLQSETGEDTYYRLRHDIEPPKKP